jgi:hypothetical protein
MGAVTFTAMFVNSDVVLARRVAGRGVAAWCRCLRTTTALALGRARSTHCVGLSATLRAGRVVKRTANAGSASRVPGNMTKRAIPTQARCP